MNGVKTHHVSRSTQLVRILCAIVSMRQCNSCCVHNSCDRHPELIQAILNEAVRRFPQSFEPNARVVYCSRTDHDVLFPYPSRLFLVTLSHAIQHYITSAVDRYLRYSRRKNFGLSSGSSTLKMEAAGFSEKLVTVGIYGITA